MTWLNTINKATNYIEQNLTSDLKLDSIAKECNVSYHYFSKVFTLITGYTLKEYIRNRRITLASYEIVNSEQRIIDIAFKYGYSSNESFSRAFKKIHGINPSEARRKGMSLYTHFPVLNYNVPDRFLISLRYEIIHDIDYKFIGRSMFIKEENYKETQDMQLQFVTDFCEENDIKDFYVDEPKVFRVHHNINLEKLEYDYFVGIKRDYKLPIKESYNLHVTAPKAIKFVSHNIDKNQISEIKKIIYDEWYKNKYEIDGVCEIEYTIINKNETLDFFYIVSIK